MEIGLVLLGAIVGAIFYSVIQGLTRKVKTKTEIENEIEYYKLHNYNEFTKGIINGLEWVLNNKNK